MNKNRIMSKCHSFVQNRTRLIVIVLLLALLVSACGSATATQPAGSARSVSQVEAAVTATLSAQATASAQAISSATPTATLLPTATPTPYVLPTTVPATATPQTLYSNYYTNYGCEDSQFIKDVTIPDDTVLTAGETFVKTWKFKNSGSCAWDSDFSLVFVSGDNMDGSDTGIDQTVNPSKKADISVELTAPDAEGTYTGYWQLADAYGNAFGEKVYVEIVVENVTAPGQATLISPTGAIATTIPAYTWYEVSGATNYLLQVNGSSGTLLQAMYTTTEASCNGTTCSIVPALPLSDGTYTWWIQAWNSGGWGQASNGFTFTVSTVQTPTSTTVPTSTPTAITPVATSTVEPTATSLPTETSTPVAPTSTSVPTETLTPAPTSTEIATATNTAAPTSTSTALPSTSTPTPEPIVTNTPLPTLVPTETSTPVPTSTSIEAPTVTNTVAPTATSTVPPSTATPTPKPTETEHHHHS